jgi:hypothetical protein
MPTESPKFARVGSDNRVRPTTAIVYATSSEAGETRNYRRGARTIAEIPRSGEAAEGGGAPAQVT